MDAADRAALPISWRLALAGSLGVSWTFVLVAGVKAMHLSQSTLLGPAAFLFYLTGPILTSLFFRRLLPAHLRGRWTAVIGLAGVVGYAAPCALVVVVPVVLQLVHGSRPSLGTTAVVWLTVLLSVSPVLAALAAFAATDSDPPGDR